MNEYKPLVKPPDPPDLELSFFGNIVAKLPIVGCSSYHRQWNPIYNRLKQQLEERRALPREIWGSDPLRRELAAFIAKRVQEAFCWPNNHFLPEDSFWVMMFPPEDDLCGVEAMMDIEDYVGMSISEADAVRICEMTFGEVVDFLRIANRRNIPILSPEDPERHWCPRAAVFWNLRAFATENLGIDRRTMRPQAQLRAVFPGAQTEKLAHYVAARFNVHPVLRLRVFGFLPSFWTWIVLYVLAAEAVRLCAGSCFWWYILIAPIPLAILLGRLARKTMPPRLATIRDLVKWILSQRRIRAAERMGASG